MRKMDFIGLVATLVVSLIATVAVSAELGSEEQRLVEWIDAHAEDAISLIEETVNIGSGTMNHSGVREVGRVMQRELDAIGLQTEWIDMPEEVNRAGHLFGRKVVRARIFCSLAIWTPSLKRMTIFSHSSVMVTSRVALA